MIEKYDPLKGKMLRILNPDGRCDEKLKPDLSDETVQNLYRQMVFIRQADQRDSTLQRQGRLGTYAPCQGQEAAQVGSAYALGEADWIFPSFREMGACYMRGLPLKDIFVYWMGDEKGQKVPEGVNVFPISIPVGSHPLHAVGVTWAAQLQGDKICTLAYFGDGATSEGDFHEAMNFAGVFGASTIFFCQNNQYAISVPRKIQTAAKTLAQKSVVAGLEEHPYVNASLDDENEEVIVKKYFNIGVAVDTKDGLMVPVVKNAKEKSILQLADELTKLSEKARSRTIDLADLKGGTFTITNYGPVEGIFGAPIINYPEVAILGVGKLQEKPVVVKEKIEVRKVLPLSLSFDHRAVDGAEAARFVNTVADHLEDPDLILLEA